MPKLKSKRGAAKRFKLTASGIVKHRRAKRNHILTKKSAKQKSQKRAMGQIKPCDTKGIRKLLISERVLCRE
jgi:large subunit ribosomal protein L35